MKRAVSLLLALVCVLGILPHKAITENQGAMG